MVHSPKLSVDNLRAGFRLANLWHVIHTWVTRVVPSRKTLPSRISVVAVVVGEQDRLTLAGVSRHEPFDVQFAESWEEAWAIADQLAAPIVLFDRDCPGPDWKRVVQNLAASPHGACVILLSGVSDDYLWQELIRRGGYDVLPKPLKADSVARVLQLAWSYWNNAPKVAVLSRAARARRG
jgi:DNA-binding NtrC family response regulator